jgi:serine/threonine protein kinase/Tol biopolymer transport system component
MIGTQFNQYQVTATLGVGGMGEVFRARDTRLNREVAIKLLPKALASDPDRLRRFEQEAKTLAALNHPNILTVYDAGVHDGMPYLVSELLDGQTLRDVLGGPKAAALSARKAIEYALQIAHGLAAAHHCGIIHRDLKPENVFITKDGRVKMLDFGLAKLSSVAADVRRLTSRPSDTLVPTAEMSLLTSAATEPGVVLGTPAYMAPEQVRGEATDHRSDIFAFGCVLYEMLTGIRTFKRDTAVESMHAVLNEEPPDLSASGLSFSPGLERMVRRCLDKRPERRFQSASDLAFALETLSTADSSGLRTVQPEKGRASRLRMATAAALVGLAAVGGGMAWLILSQHPQKAAAPARLQLSIPMPAGSQAGRFCLSPDGRYLAFTTTSGNKSPVMLRSLADGAIRTVPEVESAGGLFWSADSRFIGFYESERSLMAAPFNGGKPHEICPARGGGAAWSQEGSIVFTEYWGTGLFRVPAEGGRPTPLTTLNTSEHEGAHLWPQFLPDGRHFLFLVRSVQPEDSHLWVGDVNSGSNRQRLIEADALVGWVDPDQVVYARGGALYSQSFDLKHLVFTGSAHQVTDSVAWLTVDSDAAATVSRNGLLAYRTEPFAQRQLTWLDRAGQPVGTLGAPTLVRSFRLSPDQRSLAFSRFDRRKGTYNLWRIDLASGAEDRLTSLRNAESAVWSPDSSEVIYDSDELILFNLYRRRLDRSMAEEPLYKTSSDDKNPRDWSSDGKHVLFGQLSATNSFDIWVLALDNPSHPEPLLHSEAAEEWARFSPDGRWVAYTSVESEGSQIYLQSFPNLGPRIPVSHDGGDLPVWNPNGQELFFVDRKGTLMAADITTDSSGALQPGPPKALFPKPANAGHIEAYDVSRDGKRFLYALDAPNAATNQNIVVLLNWRSDGSERVRP